MLDTITSLPAAADAPLRVPYFALTGAHAGPRLVVTGPDALMRDVSDRFWELPELISLRGSLVIRGEGQDPAFDGPDVVMTLAGGDATTGYLRVLGRMTALCMIAGRGVPARWVA